MPKRTDLKKILLIGSGPIVIGQGCEFDYSGTQACKVLKEEGYQVVLVNSNPATIMTDPELADATYIEPILPEVVEKIIEIERPDALLPTMGGQTALNVAVALVENGTLEKYGVSLIGANYDSIKMAENRNLFKKAMEKTGLEVPRSGYVRSKDDALAIIEDIGFPAIIRASFTLGGSGGSIAYNREEFELLVEAGIAASPSREVLVEESVLGWKEFELELMRDKADNVVIICSIENIDPMGVHTGDSITVAPVQTLSDRQYQKMRDAAIRVIREIGVETGGSNIQFAVNPADGRMVVIEMNPRVSRSSALSSKATGYPIAKIAAKLAIGYTLDEIPNDITRVTPASFEPVIDYVVVKIPRFDFEKFPLANATLSPQMKSVGEAMAIGRTFKESLQKAIQSLEVDRPGLVLKRGTELPKGEEKETLRARLKTPNWERIFYIAEAFRHGFSVDEIYGECAVDPWFLYQIEEIVRFETELSGKTAAELANLLKKAKEWGFSDIRLAELTGLNEREISDLRHKNSLLPVFKRVDTCAAEFEAYTPYLYSTYESECEAAPSGKKKVMILGGGPNRIGQGIEFDYCCVHGVLALKEDGYETIMVNCNPETVSTDYDTADRLYFEPLTFEHVLRIIQLEKPEGVVVQLGGQTPLKLAIPLEEAGVKILGTSPDSIDLAEDRERFRELIERLGLLQPESGTARSVKEATIVSGKIGYPVMVRPSYVLGGKAMRVVYDEQGLVEYMTQAVSASSSRPVLVDKYLEDATEVDVDALSDREEVMIGGIMEHIEEAGVHSGDSACSLPPFSLPENIIDEIRRQTVLLAKALRVVGLLNIQFAVKGGNVYILEVNPRASRTVPFVSKTAGLPLAKIAIRLMTGEKLKSLVQSTVIPPYFHVAVKEAVFPFNKFPGVDTILGPEMKSTGEVMGIDDDFGKAFAKSQSAAGNPLPLSGNVFLSVKDKDKQGLVPLAKDLERYGFTLIGTRGTVEYLRTHGVSIKMVNKVAEGRPHVVDFMKNREIQLSINTVGDQASQKDSFPIRQTTLHLNIPYFTTMAGARAAIRGIGAVLKDKVKVKSLQQYHLK